MPFTVNSSSNSSAVDPNVYWFYLWTVKYFLLFSIPTGIISNTLILLTLPRSTVRLNSRSRYVYLFYTISDCFLLIFKDFEDGFLDHTLYWLSDGKVYVFLEALSTETCKIMLSAAYITEILAAYSITTMILERFVNMLLSDHEITSLDNEFLVWRIRR